MAKRRMHHGHMGPCRDEAVQPLNRAPAAPATTGWIRPGPTTWTPAGASVPWPIPCRHPRTVVGTGRSGGQPQGHAGLRGEHRVRRLLGGCSCRAWVCCIRHGM